MSKPNHTATPAAARPETVQVQTSARLPNPAPSHSGRRAIEPDLNGNIDRLPTFRLVQHFSRKEIAIATEVIARPAYYWPQLANALQGFGGSACAGRLPVRPKADHAASSNMAIAKILVVICIVGSHLLRRDE
jgi:hypothetical protein